MSTDVNRRLRLKPCQGDSEFNGDFTSTIVGSGNSEPLIPEILSRSVFAGESSSEFR